MMILIPTPGLLLGHALRSESPELRRHRHWGRITDGSALLLIVVTTSLPRNLPMQLAMQMGLVSVFLYGTAHGKVKLPEPCDSLY